MRSVRVHLATELVPGEGLEGCVAVVIDVLRATTTMIYALAAGCRCIRPCADLDEARKLASEMPAGKVLLTGERGGEKLPDFDLGNSPAEFTPARCKGMTIVMTTSNGTRALVRAAKAERVLIAGFVNYSTICEQLKADSRPLHIVCSGSEGEITLEDTLLAGALVEFLCDETDVELNDGARIAWDSFENHGRVLQGSLEISQGGATLKRLGYDEDIRLAGEVDKFALSPELRRDPLRVEVGAVGVGRSRWKK